MTDRRGLVEVVDVHVGGDVHRIVMGGIKEPPGASPLEKMNYLKDHADGLRQLLLMEPRGGHPSLYADLIVEPSDPAADAGFVIMELLGYPLISGTNTISTAVALLETGRVQKRDGTVPIALQVPGGLIRVRAECEADRVRSVTYEALAPSFVEASDLIADLPGCGPVEFDLIWTGAFYPVIDAASVGLSLVREDEAELVRFAKDFLTVARPVWYPIHPEFGDDGPLALVVFVGPLEVGENGIAERRVCCYEHLRSNVCRSPAGAPSTAAALQLLHRGQLRTNDTLRTVSVFGNDLHVAVLETLPYHHRQGTRFTVTGTGWVIARSQLVVDLDDPMTPKDGLELVLG